MPTHPKSRAYSRESYLELVGRLVREGYRFASFEDTSPAGDRSIYLRHDVDYSLGMAVELAELNNELEVAGTFFVQTRAQFYNVHHPLEQERIRRLTSLGQGAALHVVLGDDPRPSLELVSSVLDEFEHLGRIGVKLVPAFSWHQPPRVLLEAGELEVPGLVNVYGRRFFQEMQYVSDSTYRHDRDELEAILVNGSRAETQLLLHPVNWIVGGSSGVELLIRGWMYVLRDHERTLMENRTFAERFPGGMPAPLIDDFERALTEATGAS
jgi:hypothetical protein